MNLISIINGAKISVYEIEQRNFYYGKCKWYLHSRAEKYKRCIGKVRLLLIQKEIKYMLNDQS